MCTKWHDEPDLRIAAFEQCYVMLNRDQFFQGYCLVFTREHVTELFHLEKGVPRCGDGRGQQRGCRSSQRLCHPAKINYELLGNMVPHMHWHVVPRFTADPLWPRPIWSEAHSAVELAATEYAQRIALIKSSLEA